MKHLQKLTLLILIAFTTLTANAQYVTLSGKQFMDVDGVTPFFPLVMNYRSKIIYNSSAPGVYKLIRDRQFGSTDCLLEPTSRYTWINSELSIEDDFEKIKLMGFNTIRLLLAPSRKNSNDNLGGFTFELVEFNTTGTGETGGMCNSPRSQFSIGPSDYTSIGGDAQTYFSLVAHALDVAQSHNIKVILLCADHSGEYTLSDGTKTGYPEMGSSDTDAADYASYLSALAAVIKNKPALIAYDLYNEPNFSIDFHHLVDKKDKICEYVSTWYNALKTVDPNHLITIGGTDHGDVLGWDSGVMKLDFVSMHIYPYPGQFVAANSPVQIERIENLIKWCSNALQKPWIIGETGFPSSSESCLQPYIWGDNATMSNYHSAILNASRDCGASGFSWWGFQDVHYYCVPDAVCNPSCTYCDNWDGYCGMDLDATSPTYEQFTPASLGGAISNIAGNYYGMLSYGDPDASTGLYPASVDKQPAVNYNSTFLQSSAGSCPVSSFYFNPFQHPENPVGASGQPTTIHGNIKDQNGQPIKDAMIFGYTPVNTSAVGDINTDLHYTFTDANGDFTIIPLDYKPLELPNDNNITDLKISAVACGRTYRNEPDVIDGENFVLERMKLDYDANVNSVTVMGGSTQYFQGWETLTASNVIIQATATSEFKARNEVNVQSEFHAATGSEVHIYCAETFAECPSFSDFRRSTTSPSVTNEETNSTKSEIEMHFRKKNILDFSIEPNPNNGKFNITLSESAGEMNVKAFLNIYSVVGNQVYSGAVTSAISTIDLSAFAKGIYYVVLKTENKTTNKKIIIQ